VHPPAAPSAGIGNASVTIIPASIAWFLIDLTGAPQRALRPTQRSTNARAWRQRDDVSPDFRRLAVQLKRGNACRERGKSFL
jgi:hypothetical protein